MNERSSDASSNRRFGRHGVDGVRIGYESVRRSIEVALRELGAEVGELAVDDAQAVDQLRVGGLAVARHRAQRGGDAGVAADEIGELVGADLVATRRPGDEWDIAAAAPIAAEAGVTVSDALSRRLVFNQATPRASGVLERGRAA